MITSCQNIFLFFIFTYVHIKTTVNIPITYYYKSKVLSKLSVEKMQETAIISKA